MLLKHKCIYKTALRIFLLSHQPWITELWSQATLHYQLHYDSQILFILTIPHGSIIIPSHVWFIKVFCSKDKCYNMPYCNHANYLSSFPYLNYAFAELFSAAQAALMFQASSAFQSCFIARSPKFSGRWPSSSPFTFSSLFMLYTSLFWEGLH